MTRRPGRGRPMIRAAAVAMTAAVVLTAAGCDGTKAPTAPTAPATTGSLFIRGVPPEGLAAGSSTTLEAVVIEADGTVRTPPVDWTSSDPAVASIDQDGVLRGVSPGRARITARASGLEASAEVRVEAVDIDPVLLAQLLFNDRDCQAFAEANCAPLDQRVTMTLPTTSPDFLVLSDTLTAGLLSKLQAAIPKAARQLTGRTYTGRIETGSDRARDNLIVVEGVRGSAVATAAHCGGSMGQGLGKAIVGAVRGCIMLNTDRRAELHEEVLLHEIGHAFGFYHVAGNRHVMETGGENHLRSFSLEEQRHAQLAYTHPRYTPHGGIAVKGFGPSLGSAGTGRALAAMRPRIFVID